jgi:predicted 2-oxoglutarate/Fe(II)-dependent dioxygenase YbiX
MSSIGAALLTSLASVERSGEFCVGGMRQVIMPTLDVDGVGTVAFPILPAQAAQLVAAAEAAPYGRGAETIVDRDVRRTWQIDARKVRIGGRQWETILAELVAEAARGLGVDEPVAADFYKLLIYDAGSFFVDHRDSEKAPGMFATLVLVLPSTHRGGALMVRHLGREIVLDPSPEEPSDIGFAAFFADCVHEVQPVTAGCRVALVYNLRFRDTRRPLTAPDHRAEQESVVEVLRSWAAAEDEPLKLVVPLEHAYTPAELSFGALKGADAGIASVLVQAAAAADCDLHLALVSIEESGTADHTGSYGRRRWGRGDEDDEEFEIGEVFDRSLILSHWRRPDGAAAAFEEFPFDENELCPPDAFENLTPDEQHFHEATGNEGASFERTYSRAGLVLWPRAHRLAVLNQGGLGETLPYLEGVTARWETAESALKSSLWREADELSACMLRAWPRAMWRDERDDSPGRMLDLQARLGNLPCIEGFLRGPSTEGCYAARDNEAIVRAAALLPARQATDLLIGIVRHNTLAQPAACAGLLRCCVASPTGAVGDVGEIGTALIDELPGDPARPAQRLPGPRPGTVAPGFIVDLLTATSLVDTQLAARAIEHLLAWPETYGRDKLLVPAARAFAGLPESAAWPAVQRLRQAALDHLGARISLPLEPPRDWARVNPLRCSCADCRDLGGFLTAPDKREWRLKAIQDRRLHVEHTIKSASCDLDVTTEKRGSPHTLVAVKNQASYQRRAEQRRRDLAMVAALGG